MNVFVGINLHQRGQRETMIRIINHYKPQKYVQICYKRDFIKQEEIQGVELLSYDFNKAQYGEYPNLYRTLPLDNESLKRLNTIESYALLLLERLIHEKYNPEYSRTLPYNKEKEEQQINSITPEYNYIDRKHFIADNYRFINNLFSENKIDFLFLSEAPSTHIPYIAYHIAKDYGILPIFTEPIPIRGHRVFTTDYTKIGEEVQEEYNKLKEQFKTSKKEIEFNNIIYQEEWERLKKNSEPYYMKGKKENNIIKINYTGISRPSIFDKIKNTTKVDYWHYKLNKKGHPERSKKLRDFYESICVSPNINAPYIYVPLHLQPERTSLPLGGYFGEQLLMVEMLSYHLPQGYTILVKENPKQLLDYRSIRYYQRLKELPNVKLVSTAYDTFKLIENAKAVATLTGTVAYEAFFYEKPVFIFGYTVLQYFEDAWVVRNNKDCEKYMKQLEQKKEVNRDRLKLFFKALENIGNNFPFYKENNLIDDKTLVENLTQGYIAFIDKIKQK